jgi:hypothetical protein
MKLKTEEKAYLKRLLKNEIEVESAVTKWPGTTQGRAEFAQYAVKQAKGILAQL